MVTHPKSEFSLEEWGTVGTRWLTGKGVPRPGLGGLGPGPVGLGPGPVGPGPGPAGRPRPGHPRTYGPSKSTGTPGRLNPPWRAPRVLRLSISLINCRIRFRSSCGFGSSPGGCFGGILKTSLLVTRTGCHEPVGDSSLTLPSSTPTATDFLASTPTQNSVPSTPAVANSVLTAKKPLVRTKTLPTKTENRSYSDPRPGQDIDFVAPGKVENHSRTGSSL